MPSGPKERGVASSRLEGTGRKGRAKAESSSPDSKRVLPDLEKFAESLDIEQALFLRYLLRETCGQTKGGKNVLQKLFPLTEALYDRTTHYDTMGAGDIILARFYKEVQTLAVKEKRT